MGVMLGVTVLILVISVMTGFDRELRQKVIDFDAHILVTTETTLTNWRELTEKIRATPRVVATAPFRGVTDRNLHLYMKVKATPQRFPRRPGIARKRPLGSRSKREAEVET